MWSAVRALNDRAATLETLAEDAARLGNGTAAEGYVERSKQARQEAELARQFMFDVIKPR